MVIQKLEDQLKQILMVIVFDYLDHCGWREQIHWKNNNNKDNLKVGRQSTFKVKVSGYYPCKNIQQGRKGRFSTQISWRCMLELDKGQMLKPLLKCGEKNAWKTVILLNLLKTANRNWRHFCGMRKHLFLCFPIRSAGSNNIPGYWMTQYASTVMRHWCP